jgi:ubiquitin C-terminal hydrolase
VYDLSSVVVHRGSTLESGHYLTFSKIKQEGLWMEFDDSQVFAINPVEVANLEAYLLVYVAVAETKKVYRKGSKFFFFFFLFFFFF